MTIALAACLTLAPMGACVAEMDTGSLEGLQEIYTPPSWATESWCDYASHIVSGETVPGCPACDLWIACTIRRDVERSWHAWGLFPRRWHGYKRPNDAHRRAVDLALTEDGCSDVPHCRYLGNQRDFLGWSHYGIGLTIGNVRGAIVCVP